MLLFAPVGSNLIEGKGLNAYPGNAWRTFVQDFRTVPQTMHAVGEVAAQLSINALGTEIDDQKLKIVLEAFHTIICPPLNADEKYHYDLGVDRAKISNRIAF